MPGFFLCPKEEQHYIISMIRPFVSINNWFSKLSTSGSGDSVNGEKARTCSRLNVDIVAPERGKISHHAEKEGKMEAAPADCLKRTQSRLKAD
jgi:hypothetical protein